MENNYTTTNCRDEDGITVGLIDALINIARVLAKRDFKNSAVKEALKDLVDDEDIARILREGKKLKNFL